LIKNSPEMVINWNLGKLCKETQKSVKGKQREKKHVEDAKCKSKVDAICNAHLLGQCYASLLSWGIL
jgi:hypothetical protein